MEHRVCQSCFEDPCICGREYENMSRLQLEAIRHALDKAYIKQGYASHQDYKLFVDQILIEKQSAFRNLDISTELKKRIAYDLGYSTEGLRL